jgi:plastocyanin
VRTQFVSRNILIDMGGQMKGLLLLALCVSLLGLAAGCSGAVIAEDAPATRGVTEVAVKDMKFTPRVIEVPAGTTVTWRFQDSDTVHDVKADDFRSAVMRTGDFTHTFSTPGKYDYHCSLHSQMTARVIVTE